MRATLVTAVVLGLSIASTARAGQAKVDVTGKWVFAVETSAGNGMPVVTLMQDGEKLTGHYASSQLGEADLTGTVKGSDITFSFAVEVQGIRLDVTYSGTIENNESMKGTVSLGDLGAGKFTGKRQ
jgi:hypothetical protein